jgi:hypothetical protein
MSINPTTGAVSGSTSATGNLRYHVTVTDGAGTQGTTQACSITVNPPPAPACPAAPVAGTEGVAITPAALSATGGTGGSYTYAITGLPAGLYFDSASNSIKGTPTATAASGTTYQVKATDALQVTSTPISCPVTITPPTVTCAPAATTTGEAGVLFASGTPTLSGGAAGFQFTMTPNAGSALPNGSLAINGSTGVVSGTAAAAGTYNIQAVDATGNAAGGSCQVTILAPLTAACPSPALSGTDGVYLASQAVSVSGGAAGSYTYSSGPMPSGLSLAGTTISGTPTTISPAGTTYAITVKDAYNTTGVPVSCPITITPPALNCGGTSAGEVGAALTSATPGLTPPGAQNFHYVLSGGPALPNGTLTFSSSTGVLSGVPAAAGAYSITAVDANGNAATGSCNVPIAPAPVLTCSSLPNSGTVGTRFDSGAMTVTGGTSSYTFFVSGTTDAGNPTLGLALNPSTGDVSGTPGEAGTFSIGVRDSAGSTAAGSCPFTFTSVIVTAPTPAVAIGRGDTATIGFWHNKNGQALINSLNGGPSSTALGNWLASNFPYLYGPQAGSANDMTNKTNAQVAAYDLSVFTSDKTGAQILGGAIAGYVTNTVLAGGTYAGSYGFNTSTSGTGSHTWNVGSNGSGAGLSNNQSYTVMELLQQVNLSKQNGTYNSAANSFNVIFDGINQGGDIT